MKRPIDVKRDGAGSFTVGNNPDDAITDMVVIDDRMIIISKFAVHETRLADQIDPERTDINLPQVIQRQLLPYGSNEAFVRATLQMAKALFDTHHLGPNFDKKRALSQALKAATDFAAMADLKRGLQIDQKAAIDKLTGTTIGNQLKLPTIPNLASRIGLFLAHCRSACLSLIAISELFYPKARQNEPWRENLEKGLSKYLNENEAARPALTTAIHKMEFINNARNAFEHPDNTKGVTVLDFAIVPGGKFQIPRVKITFDGKILADANIDYFVDSVLDNFSVAFEELCALLCDANITPSGPIETRVGQQPAEIAVSGSKYAYQSWFKEGVALTPGPTQKK